MNWRTPTASGAVLAGCVVVVAVDLVEVVGELASDEVVPGLVVPVLSVTVANNRLMERISPDGPVASTAIIPARIRSSNVLKILTPLRCRLFKWRFLMISSDRVPLPGKSDVFRILRECIARLVYPAGLPVCDHSAAAAMPICQLERISSGK